MTAKPNTEFVRPFRMGDVVLLARANADDQRELDDGDLEVTSVFGLNVEHIIHEVNIDYDSYQYSTNRGAWFEHSQFDLVRECDAESMAALKAALIDDEDEGEEESDDEEEEWDLSTAGPSTAFTEGLNHADYGTTKADCPYDEQTESDERLDWLAGYQEGWYRRDPSLRPAPKPTDEELAFGYGRAARRGGLGMEENPYEPGSLRTEWKEGWKMENQAAG